MRVKEAANSQLRCSHLLPEIPTGVACGGGYFATSVKQGQNQETSKKSQLVKLHSLDDYRYLLKVVFK